MTSKVGGIAAATLIALVSGCVTVSPPVQNTTPAPVQFTFNVTSAAQSSSVKALERGAVSGMPQHMGFFYAVNPDCTSDGLVQTIVKTPARCGPKKSAANVHSAASPNMTSSR
jgi:hypothetical protein